ncbi:MAG TPA: phosphatidate cytidylyltransferase [Victivallales bacterium]|nr:phosphatidate cytidylyltransferase [Victivallales bacterium]HRR05652.1 phosphatidate cytidylyltransferase [Victivallales bacterium]HRR28503.1 phosphatidate cytidylyltransferase [Victivallales bacterium]HRU00180.1 phosphatidate cytidylyltransferase [Victivallales bacterium]
MKAFILRFLSSIVLIILFCWILFSHGKTAVIMFSILSSTFTFILSLEFYNFFSKKIESLSTLSKVSAIFSFLTPLFIILGLSFNIKFHNILLFFLFLFFIFFSVIIIFISKKYESFMALIFLFFPILIFIIPLTFIIPLYFNFRNSGVNYPAFLILVTKSGDIGAYVVGMLTAKYMPGGNHKMISSVSPKKSWEGFMGGLLASIVTSYFCKSFVSDLFSLYGIVILSILLYFFAVLGDLMESSIKRIAEVKDSGSIIPGIGGLLDLTDSLILNTPLFYLITTQIKEL